MAPRLFLLAALALCAGTVAAEGSRDPASALFSAFSSELEAAFNRQEVSFLVKHFDAERFARRVLQGTGFPPALAERVRTQSSRIVIQQLTAAVAADLKGAQWTFLRLTVAEDNAERRTALFRIKTQDDALSYWEFYLSADGDKVKVDDWINYATGDLASDVLKYAYSLGGKKGGMASWVFGRPDKAETDALGRFFRAFNKKDYRGALGLYQSLPLRYQADPFVLMARLTAAQTVGVELYNAALADLAKYFGDDPRFALLLSDHFLGIGDYANAHRAIDHLSQRIGGDVALTVAHGNIDYAARNYSRAVEHYRRAIQEDQDFEDTYWSLLELFATRGNYEDAVLVLRILARHFGYTFNAAKLAQTDGYAQFAASQPFRAWAASVQ